MDTIHIFPWDEHFNTGIEEIDGQHYILVKILNQLASHVAYHSNEKDLSTIFNELIDYTLYHFQTEESIWHQHIPNDPLEEKHQALHQVFIDTVTKLKNEQNSRSLHELAEEALGFLAHWLASHILESDRYMSHLVSALEDELDIDDAQKQAECKMSGSSRVLIDIILSIYSTHSSNALQLMNELKTHKQHEDQLEHQKCYRDLLLELSTEFINLPLNKINVAIKEALSKIAKFVEVDRAYIFDYDFNDKTLTNTYEWCAQGIKPTIDDIQKLPMSFVSDLPKIHAQGEYVLIEDVTTLEDNSFRNLLVSQNIQSLIIFPLFSKGVCEGFIGFDSVKEKRNFSSMEIELLKLFSKLLGNIADRKYNESEIAYERNSLKTLFEAIPDLVWMKDLKGVYLSCNSHYEDFIGIKEAELIGKTDYDFLDKYIADSYTFYDMKVIESDKTLSYEEDVSYAHNNQKATLHTTKVPMYNNNGQIYAVLGISRDITDMKKIQKELEHIAYFDKLTNLPNRTLLLDRLHQAMLQAQRQKVSLAIIHLDLDNFKEINDMYGHSNGDILLKNLSDRIKKTLREADTIARLGGDDFVIVLDNLKSQEDSIVMLERILSIVSEPVISEELSMQVSVSMGVTFYNYHKLMDPDQLLRQADQAMYQAKLSGKNRFNIFDTKFDEQIRKQNEKLKAIEKAIHNNEFILYYQPKVNMKSGEILGSEALIRWNHPTKGILSPGMFLPLIENHHLSVELDLWVLNRALQQIQEWKKEEFNMLVSINVSPMLLQKSDFLETILQLLENYPEVKPSDFELEILETSALADIDHISQIIQECNKIGLSFLLDDFGTGYSSLTYLKALPAKQLKIDQSFVHDMLDDTDDMAILEGVVGLANAFRLELIAEGVESIEQGQMLLRLGCEQAQGYVVARPIPPQELQSWKKQWKQFEEWKNIRPVSREETPFLYALVEHKIRINQVISYLRGEIEFLSEINHKECKFGKWLYNSEDVKNIAGINTFKKIETLHDEIHNKVHNIVKQYKNQTIEDIENSIKEIRDVHHHFSETFTNLLLS